MRITVGGTPGSGKSTVAKALAKRLGYKHYSAGDFMRHMAEKRSISLMELQKLAETDEEIDKELDDYNKRLVDEDNFVIDARLAFHFIPDSIKIFLKIRPEIAAQRTYGDIQQHKRTTEEGVKSEKEMLEGLQKRMQSEIDRYKKYYNINHLDESNFDFVLDTSDRSIEECVNSALDFLRSKGLKID